MTPARRLDRPWPTARRYLPPPGGPAPGAAGRSGLEVAGVLLVGPDDAGIGAEERMLGHVRGVAGCRGRLARRLRHRADVVRRGATADTQVAHAERDGLGGELAQLVAGAG